MSEIRNIKKDFTFDSQQEKFVIKALEETLIKKYLLLKHKIKYKIIDFANNHGLQFSGVDIIFEKDGKEKFVDVKAQTNNYIGVEGKTGGPTDTFCLELSYFKDGVEKLGWFLNNTLKTTHYIFVWILNSTAKDMEYVGYTGKKRRTRELTCAEDIIKYRAMIISVRKAKIWLYKNGCTMNVCKKAVQLLRDDNYVETLKWSPTDSIVRLYFDLKTGIFDKVKPKHGRFVTFTRTLWGEKEEQPINLVVKNEFWREIAEAEYLVDNGNIEVLKENCKEGEAVE